MEEMATGKGPRTVPNGKPGHHGAIARRTFLVGIGAAAASVAAARYGHAAAQPQTATLTPARARVRLMGPDGPETDVFAYGGRVPGPVLRAKQGERLQVTVRNGLAEPTTVHWHGLRIANRMDGVPHLTQPPIAPGETFVYDLDLADAGTFWYHPHANSAVQVGRGLKGALIIDEPDPPAVDRDVVWVLDDWRLSEDGAVAPFGNWHDLSHAGRIGNTVAINGKVPKPFPVRAGERIRLRLINAANARTFGLDFRGHSPWIVALDGHPVEPRPATDLIVLAAGARTDLILDMTGEPGAVLPVVDGYYGRFRYTLVDLMYENGAAVRSERLPAPTRLPDNPVATPSLSDARKIEMTFAGGAMGGMAEAELRGVVTGIRDLARQGMFWAIDGVVSPGMAEDGPGTPLLVIEKGRTCHMTWRNGSAFEHPIHLHGHSVHVLSRNGVVLSEPEIRDTVLVPPRGHVDVAFVADNPGDWMLHCHILEHQQAGMMGFVRVA